MQRSNPILVVDDDRSVSILICRWLESAGHEVIELTDAESCLETLSRVVPGVVCLDIELPGMSGLVALQKLRARHPHLPVIMLTAHDDVETIVEAMRSGAYEYLHKPIDKLKLLTQVRNALERNEMELRLRHLAREASGDGHPGLIGESVQVFDLFRKIDQVGAVDVTALIRGESGTGKELVARAIHAASGRRSGPFVGLNCAAIPESLQESELFGHEKGSFTGASELRRGRFELADGGTLFLDEIGELSVSAQAKLLRVLQERVFHRIGGAKETRSDFRVIAATNRDLQEEVTAGRFREDLYYRIAVFEIVIPPLRERGDDVLLLANHFLREFGQKYDRPGVTLTAEAARALLEHRWSGNIRELQNAIQHALIVTSDATISPADLALAVRTAGPAPTTSDEESAAGDSIAGASDESTGDSWEEVERRTLTEALRVSKGNVSEASRRLGIGRTTIYRKLRKYQIR